MQDKKISVKTERCLQHESYLVTVELPITNDSHAEAIEGAIEGYVNSVGCTVCTAGAIQMTVDQYLNIFIEKFLPLISQHVAGSSVVNSAIADIKPLSYG